MSDKYLVLICSKQFNRGVLLAIIISLLVFSSQKASPTIASGIDKYSQSTKTSSDLRVVRSFSDYEIWAYEQNTLDSAPLAEPNSVPILFKLVELPSGDYDTVAANRIINNLSRIPDSILSKLLVSGWKIKLINGELTDEPEYAYLKGVTPRGWEDTGMTWDDLSGLGGYPNVVVKIGYSDKTVGGINLELHETGHAVDCAFNYLSKKDSFIKIWKMEALFSDTCIFDYVNKYADEYFAESFAMYFYHNEGNEKLKAQAPLTYELISRIARS